MRGGETMVRCFERKFYLPCLSGSYYLAADPRLATWRIIMAISDIEARAVRPRMFWQYLRAILQPFPFYHDGCGLVIQTPRPGQFGVTHRRIYEAAEYD